MGGAWLAGYSGIVAICAITVLVRREPTLLRGRSALRFTALYIALAWIIAGWRSGRLFPFSPFFVVAAAIAIVITGIAAPWWFVLGGPSSTVVSTLDVCLGRVCATYERSDTGFIMTTPAGAAAGMRISVHAIPWTRISVVSLRAKPPYKKADLLRSLFAKQYRGVFPTPRIRIG